MTTLFVGLDLGSRNCQLVAMKAEGSVITSRRLCRFSAYLQTPHRFSNVRKLWRYCRLGVSHRSSDGKRLGCPRLTAPGAGGSRT